MGCVVETKCLDCGEQFAFDSGGGFFFHMLRCEKCGKTKSIGFDELGELHLQYIKGLSGPYCMASSEFDKNVQLHTDVVPISEDEYHSNIYHKIVILVKCKKLLSNVLSKL